MRHKALAHLQKRQWEKIESHTVSGHEVADDQVNED